MALIIADRVFETTTTTGTGTYTLAGAKTGFQSFAAVGNGNTTYYACTDGVDYEVGLGTYTASGTTLARTTIIESSNSDAAVNWGAGEKSIFVTLPASKALVQDASDAVTQDGDLTVTGNLTVQGTTITVDSATAQNIVLGDNDKMTFGAGSDLQIYHDGSRSIIQDNGTGNLRIQANNLELNNADNSENYLFAANNGTVTLYYDNAPKLATTSTGIDVTGSISADGLTVDTAIATSTASFRATTNSTTIGQKIGSLDFFNGTTNDAGTIEVRRASGGNAYSDMSFVASANGNRSNQLLLSTNGDISFYEDQGITPKFVWKAADERLGIGTSSPSQVLHVVNPSTSYVLAETTGTGTSAGVRLKGDASADYTLFTTQGTNQFAIYDNAAAAERLRVTSSGSVGIATSSPATTLDVAGTTTTDGLNLDAIAATISDTAVDIFVYDTRKDSDGGAWRKRTQHTSWYNETLNTSTRGSRKEFPAVAVITVDATSDYITIYDGDDPDLPMWMLFNSGGNRLIRYNTSFGGVSVVNGRMVVGNNAGIGGLSIIDFVMDFGAHYNSSDTQVRKYDALANRNVAIVAGTATSPFTTDTSNWLLNLVNDVAMTVLPNAPIDASTGLPVPTIAVATDGGHSFILDNGNVVDLLTTTYTDTDHVSFTDKGRTYNLFNAGGFVSINELPSADISTGSSLGGGDRLTKTASPAFSPNFSSSGTDIVAKSYDEAAISTGAGLTNLQYTGDTTTSMVAYTTSDYNTGWMNGDIKLATLSDTDATNVTGAELVTNGTFDTDTSGWTGHNGATLSVVSGVLRATNDGSTSYPYAQQVITTEVGKTYTVSARALTSPSHNWYIEVATLGNSGQKQDEYQSHTFTATSTSTTIRLIHRGAANGDYKDFDDVSVRLAEEDRSVNDNGLQVFGTVTKSAVATGADLVAYSGFSSSNYLRQPYNSDLDFGTSDFCYIWWADIPTTAFQTHFTREHHNGSVFVGASLEVFSDNATNKLKIFMSDDGYATYDAWVSSSTISGMQCFAVVRQGNVIHTYIDGSLDNTHTISAPAGSMDNSDATLSVGVQRNNQSANTTGSIALLRASATVPSPEQIKKIYEDEKRLFQDGAQATLYGSSDAVTALAYDDSTELLHVGTSAGRSVFQGLKRVDNTTTAVGAAISASNGLVADE